MRSEHGDRLTSHSAGVVVADRDAALSWFDQTGMGDDERLRVALVQSVDLVAPNVRVAVTSPDGARWALEVEGDGSFDPDHRGWRVVRLLSPRAVVARGGDRTMLTIPIAAETTATGFEELDVG